MVLTCLTPVCVNPPTHFRIQDTTKESAGRGCACSAAVGGNALGLLWWMHCPRWSNAKNSTGCSQIETVAVRFPTQRGRVKTSKRENFTSCGEATTFQGSYSGVEFRSSYELPLITLDEKARVLGSAASSAPPEDWQDRFGDKAVPLFWQESKPISFSMQSLMSTR